jgi:hypothetical protein
LRYRPAELLDGRISTTKSSVSILFTSLALSSISSRFYNSSIEELNIGKKIAFAIDNYFSPVESETMRTFSDESEFSILSYSSKDSLEAGEKPVGSMSAERTFALFQKPPKPILEIYKLLSKISDRLNIEITTHPQTTCVLDKRSERCANATITNKVESVTPQDQFMGMHRDYNSEE